MPEIRETTLRPIIRQVLDYAALNVEITQPSASHHAALFAYEMVAVALAELAIEAKAPKNVIRQLLDASWQFAKKIADLVDRGVVPTIRPTNLVARIVAVFDCSVELAEGLVAKFLEDIEEQATA